MAHNTHGQSSPPSYIDGISVKISESYKPPKRINLALSYSQRLTLNKLMHDPVATYDFSLEESVKNKIHEWRKARTTLAEERRQRLQQLSQEKTKQVTTDCTTEVLTNNINSDNDEINSHLGNNNDNTSSPYYCTELGVLIPKTVGSQQNNYSTSFQATVIEKGFNFSEFESDTSSPFDNMELKTINDLQELAEVLKRDRISQTPELNTTPTSSESGIVKQSPPYKNGYYFNHQTQFYSEKINESPVLPNITKPQMDTSFRITEIMKSLEADLAHNHISEPAAVSVASPMAETSVSSGPIAAATNDLESPFRNLSANMQQMAVTISTMGFPLDRVARACHALEGNQKKIVEHLLAMSDLLDLGFTEEKVAHALLKCNNDRDKALDLLIT